MNDIQSLFSCVKANDIEASGSIPIGLVVTADGKPHLSEDGLKSAAFSYPVASVSWATGATSGATVPVAPPFR